MICVVTSVFVLFVILFFVFGLVLLDFLFFFYFFVYIYFMQFFFVSMLGCFKVFWEDFFVFVVEVFGFLVKGPITVVLGGFYFILMGLICYSGHFSWNMALGRVVEFVFVWSLVS